MTPSDERRWDSVELMTTIAYLASNTGWQLVA